MGLKKYIVSSILLLIIIAGYVFSLEANDYSITILENTITFPIAVWAVVPAILLLIATIIHILFYGFRNFLNTRAIQKDELNIVNLIKDFLLENTSKQTFKTQTFKDLSSVLSQVTLNINSDFKAKDEELNNIISIINKINSNEYVNIKNMKFNKHGKIYKQNLINKINSDVDYALEILKKSKENSDDLVQIAFLKVLDEKSMTTINKILASIKLNKEMTLALFEKDKQSSEFSIGLDNIKKYAKEAKLSKQEYIDLSKLYKDTFSPEEIIKLIEELSSEDENANESYLYTLFEFEMIDEVREFLDATQANEYSAFKALLDLKDNSKHYCLDTISYKN